MEEQVELNPYKWYNCNFLTEKGFPVKFFEDVIKRKKYGKDEYLGASVLAYSGIESRVNVFQIVNSLGLSYGEVIGKLNSSIDSQGFVSSSDLSKLISITDRELCKKLIDKTCTKSLVEVKKNKYYDEDKPNYYQRVIRDNPVFNREEEEKIFWELVKYQKSIYNEITNRMPYFYELKSFFKKSGWALCSDDNFEKLRGIMSEAFEIDNKLGNKESYKNLEEKLKSGILEKIKNASFIYYDKFLEIWDKLEEKILLLVNETDSRKRRYKEIAYGIEIEEAKRFYKSISSKLEKMLKIEEKIMYSNQRLVISVAGAHGGYIQNNSGSSFMDLLQEGNMGLQKAIRRFDISKGYKFSTFASWWIKQSILRHIDDKNLSIRIPVHVHKTCRKISRIIKGFVLEKGHEPSFEIIAGIIKEDPEKIKLLYQLYSKKKVCLDSENEEGDNLYNIIEDTNVPNPRLSAHNNTRKEDIMIILRELKPQEKEVIEMRYGLNDGSPKTLEEISGKYGVTRERIRQIEVKAFNKLRHPPRMRKLRKMEDFN